MSETERLRLMRRAIERLHKEMSCAGVEQYWIDAVEDAIGLANGETKGADVVAEMRKVREQLRERGIVVDAEAWLRAEHEDE